MNVLSREEEITKTLMAIKPNTADTARMVVNDCLFLAKGDLNIDFEADNCFLGANDVAGSF